MLKKTLFRNYGKERWLESVHKTGYDGAETLDFPLQQSKLTQNSDQSNAHKTEGIKDMIEAAGAKIIYLPRYSPDFNPIEHLWWELKAFVRKFKPKMRDSVHKLVDIALLLNSATVRRNYFTHCCYCDSST